MESRRAWSVVATTVALAVATVACSSGFTPESANLLLDHLEGAELVECTDRREPVPDVVTCVAEEGDLTVGLVEDPLPSIRTGNVADSGPWIVGGDWLVITYGRSLEEVEEIRDEIGHGQVYAATSGDPTAVE